MDLPFGRPLTRRQVVRGLGALSVGGLLGARLTLGKTMHPIKISHPHLFISYEPRNAGRTVEGLRSAIDSGISKKIWENILSNCREEIGADPLLASTMIPGRPPAQARNNDPDHNICTAVSQRLLRNALATLVTEDTVYLDTMLTQLWALYDEDRWPEWITKAHLSFGYPAGLRTGMLSEAIGLAYDWSHPFTTADEKARILEGLNRRGFQPYLKSMEMDPWWAQDMHNWYSVIIGGLGIAGMAVGHDHPLGAELVDMSVSRMREFLTTYGREGEFNESVGYSNATRRPAMYFYALSCRLNQAVPPLTQFPFPEAVEWTMHSTLPPGRLAAFGDGYLHRGPEVAWIAAVAAATRNPVTQGFALHHMKVSSNPLDLLYYDASLETRSPDGVLPQGRAYHDNGALIYSRTSWDYDTTPMVAYGKAKRDKNHDHNDVGQLCIDVHGERMIVDLGNPSKYPSDFFEEQRWEYYNASVTGHNVFQFGEREQKFVPSERGVREGFDYNTLNGVITYAAFEDHRGGSWQINLSKVYDGVQSVRRTVMHLHPGFVACLDEALLEEPEQIRMRWHTISAADVDAEGHFSTVNNHAGLACRMVVLDGGAPVFTSRRHQYQEPYHRDRNGELLEQRREPYIEMALQGHRCRMLTLFAGLKDPHAIPRWHVDGGIASIDTGTEQARFILQDNKLIGENRAADKRIKVAL